MTAPSNDELQAAYRHLCEMLLGEATPEGHWTGELSASALSTATAVAALTIVNKKSGARSSELQPLIQRGLAWLAEHQNEDGGWGDTILSFSNISTTMLTRAAFALNGDAPAYREIIDRGIGYIERQGGVEAVKARYGKDRTFSAPILTQCALAGLVDWADVAELPFELATLPHKFYKLLNLPVVSYALPALIAIGQVRHQSQPSWNPLMRGIRNLSVKPTLKKLQAIQPSSGGFLEAIPLTSFVTMSLSHVGQHEHPVVIKGVEFLTRSVSRDGSWPIDVNLATWVTTLAVNGMGVDPIPVAQQQQIAAWLLNQQLKTVHPYTQADPGGWAWTDLPGGVPDADDTPGAILALLKLGLRNGLEAETDPAISRAVDWLLDLQNSDGGWPTFCRGWGALPFDRSASDLTAHVIRAMTAWKESLSAREFTDSSRQSASQQPSSGESVSKQLGRIDQAITRGFKFLHQEQQADGSWLPLWFGNQQAPDDVNPVYGTSRVLLAYRETDRMTSATARRGLEWLVSQQNKDGGWGGIRGARSSVEETALAVDALCHWGGTGAGSTKGAGSTSENRTGNDEYKGERNRGLGWLLQRIQAGAISEAAPIGLYFAKLWYFERLYPLLFAVGALRRELTSRKSSKSGTQDDEGMVCPASELLSTGTERT